jgi:hypothetical protein
MPVDTTREVWLPRGVNRTMGPGRPWQDIGLEERQAAVRPANKARRRQGTKRRVLDVVERAGELSPEDFELLRSVLPDPGDDEQVSA